MRIALVSRRFDAAGGGTERDLVLTARILTAAGHAVTIYAGEIRSSGKEFELHRIPVLSLNRTLGLLSFAITAGRVARRKGVELVLSFARISNADMLRSGGGAHSTYLRAARHWQGHAAAAAMWLSPYHRAQVAMEQAAFRAPTLRCTIAVSELVRQDLLATFGLPPGKVVTLYNGVDLERFTPNRDSALSRTIRREFQIPEDVPAVAFVGNGFARKGLSFLLEAWPSVGSRAALVVAGKDRALEGYRRLAARWGIGSRVIFAGAVTRIERLFAAVDAVVLPSLFEPFGNVVLEAMAAGLPVLCSKQTGAAEIVARELHQLVVADPTDTAELAGRVNLLVKVGRQMAAAARATAEQYTWDRYGKELLRVISSAGVPEKN